MPKRERPPGVAILAVIALISGLISLFTGLITILLRGIAILSALLRPLMPYIVGGSLLMGLLLLIIGFIWTGIGLGLWRGRSWARYIAIAFGVIYLIGGLFSLSLIRIVIGVIILYYFNRGYVKRFFTR